MDRDLASWPFVGRDNELGELIRALTDGEQRGAVLVGPAGMGKTALAARAADAARAAGMLVLSAHATPALRQIPFGAMASILPADLELPTQDLSALLRTYAWHVGQLAGDRRLLLSVDDAQLLDDPAAVLLDQLAHRGDITLLLTVRAGEPVPDTITSLWKDGWLGRVELRALDATAVRLLVEQVLGGRLAPSVAERIVERSRGNAMFIRELVTAAIDEGRFHDDAGVWQLDGWPAASDRLVDLVGSTLSRLTEDEERLLEHIAFAEPLGLAELEALDLHQSAERLERLGLVASSLSGRRLELRLAHPMIGEVLGRRITALARQRVAAARAEALERTGLRRRGDALVVANWRLHSGGGTAELLTAGALSARRRHDYLLTERLANAAVERGSTFTARYLAAEAPALLGRPVEAEEKLAALVPIAPTDEARARLAATRTFVALRAGRATLEYIDEVEPGITDQRWRDLLDAARAPLLVATTGHRASLAALAPMIARGTDPLPDTAYLVGVHDLSELGRLAEAIELLARARGTADPGTTTGAWEPELLHRELELLTYAGRLADAEKLAVEALAAAGEPDVLLHVYGTAGLAGCRVEQGRVREGAALAERTFRMYHEIGRAAPAWRPGLIAASAWARAGDVVAARRVVAALGDIASHSIVGRSRLPVIEGWLLVSTGQPEQGRQVLFDAAAPMVELGQLQQATAALHAVAMLGDAAAARGPLTEVAGEMDGDLVAARVAHVDALCADDPEALERVAREFERLGANLYAAEADAACAMTLQRLRHEREATFAARRAAALAARCDVAPLGGLPTLESGDDLTADELATARLAAAGRSNRAIADELIVSIRTIENRLYRVYAKLGISGRDELADALRALGHR